MKLPAFSPLPDEPAAPPGVPAAQSKTRRYVLPDGVTLQCSTTRRCRYSSLTAMVDVTTPEEAMVLLYLCSPEYDPRARWQPAETGDGEAEALNEFLTIRQRVEEWADRYDPKHLAGFFLMARAILKDEPYELAKLE
jgi:hypothetical protein